jgi:hypothetical protein
VAGGVPPKWNSRVCVPVSVSTFSVVSSCQVMCTRPGNRISPAAPYPLHCSPAASSLAGSHASSTFLDSGVTGMLDESPLSGVTMRQRQSSAITDTQ